MPFNGVHTIVNEEFHKLLAAERQHLRALANPGSIVTRALPEGHHTEILDLMAKVRTCCRDELQELSASVEDIDQASVRKRYIEILREWLPQLVDALQKLYSFRKKVNMSHSISVYLDLLEKTVEEGYELLAKLVQR